MTTRAQKLQNAAARLNGDRGKMPEAYQRTGERGKVQFHPCTKADVFQAALYPPVGTAYRPDRYRGPGLADIDDTTVLSVVELRASLIICDCHGGMSANQLMELEYIEQD